MDRSFVAEAMASSSVSSITFIFSKEGQGRGMEEEKILWMGHFDFKGSWPLPGMGNH